MSEAEPTGPIAALAPGGTLSAAIPHFEDRPEQRRMAAAIGAALADERALLVEAGTGTGKTLAYLVPALESGRRVIVSTGTRALQDQIVRNDLPLLRQIVERPFTAVALKGVGNYVCKRKLAELRQTVIPGTRAPAVEADLDALFAWIGETTTGDRAEVEAIAEAAPIWAEVTTTPETRLGPRCPYFERCFVTQARRAAEKADLVLVNHHLYFADLALRTAHPGARVLPEHEAVIFDEAHQLEDVATEHFGVRLTNGRLGALIRDAHLAGGFGATHTAAIADVERAMNGFFAEARRALTALAGDGGRVVLPPELLSAGPRAEAWFALDGALEELARACDLEALPPPPDHAEDEYDQSRREQLAAIARRCRQVRDDLAELAEQRQRAHVYWGETRGHHATTLAAAPIAVADLVRRHVVHGDATAIFTSATLATAAGFAYTRDRLGLRTDEVDELAVTSPFDYRRQAILYVPHDLPAPSGDGLPPEVAARAAELCAITGGRAFLLFTSHRALEQAARLLAKLPFPILRQGDAPRATLVDRFRATPGAVLLGTGSFWEGVDVPGDALSLVVIDKLPFAPHTDPLIAARAGAVAARGGDPFAELQLPQAAIALKQGFGRLIRRRDDRGIVAILDPRVVGRGYGRHLLDALPTGLPRTAALEQVRRWWRGDQPAVDGAARATTIA